jgi:hypothetical protein
MLGFGIPSAMAQAELERAVAAHGSAAEAYLNYDLQDRGIGAARRRLVKAALRRLRWLKSHQPG